MQLIKKNYTIVLPQKLKTILREINNNGLGIIFIVNDDKKLIASLTDGDIRRALLAGVKVNSRIDLKFKFMNKNPYWLPYNSSVQKILGSLDNNENKNYKCIPLLNKEKKIVDISTKYKVKSFPIAGPSIGNEELINVISAFKSGYISSVGKFIEEFEKCVEKYIGKGFAVAVSSGTSALQLALSTLNIRKGDEVLVPNFTFAASINSIISVGATPVLVDVSMENWTICVDDLKKKITKKTKAIMPVHIYGQPAHMDEINLIAKKNKLEVIEDCAEAIGAKYKGKKIGSLGNCSCFSFFANKTLTTGEGGMVIFKKKSDAEKAKVLRNHGMSKKIKYWHEHVGFNYRMTNLQAAIGVAQIKKIELILKEKKRIFDYYNSIFINKDYFYLLPDNSWSENSYWVYTLRIKNIKKKNRDNIINNLKEKGIDCRPGFYPLNEMKPYLKYSKLNYKNSKALSENMISLPSSPNLSKQDQYYIAKTFLGEVNKYI